MVEVNRSAIIKIILAIALLVFLIRWTRISDSLGELSKVNLHFFIFGIIASVSIQAIRAARFYVAAKTAGRDIGFLYTIAVQFVSSVTAFITPFRAGEGSKIFFYEKDKKTLAYFFIAEKMADMAMLLCLGIAGWLLYGSEVGQNIAYPLAALATAIPIGVFMLSKIDWFIRKVFKRDIGEGWFLQNTRRFIGHGRLFALFLALSLCVWLVMALSQQLFLWSAGIDISFTLVMLVMGISLIVGLSTGLPGGIGPRELTFTYLLFILAGVDKTAGGLAAIITTAGGLIGMTISAIPAFYLLKRRPHLETR